MKSITCAIIFLSLVVLCTSLECYKCNSRDNHDLCKDEFSSEIPPTECSSDEIHETDILYPTKNVSAPEFQCMKLKIPFENGTFFVRKCTFKISGYDECSLISTLHGKDSECFKCSSDFCNFGSTIMSSLLLTIVGILLKYLI